MRLSRKLASFPTMESQDRAALQRKRNPIRDWRERTIVEFRMLRKQTLRLTVEAIKAALLATPMSASAPAASSASVVVEDDDSAVRSDVIVEDAVSTDEVSKNESGGNGAPSVLGGSKGAGSVGSRGRESEDAGQRGATGSGRKKPQVVIPLADADVGLQQPKFLKINTPSRSEL